MTAGRPQIWIPTAQLVGLLASGAAALRTWLARRDRNATPGLSLDGLLAVLVAPPGPCG